MSLLPKTKLFTVISGSILGLMLLSGTASPVQAQATSCPVEILSTPIYWNKNRLTAVKSQISTGGTDYKVAYEKLIAEADEALSKAPYTVTDKTKSGPSGDLKDYVSLARYYWPNPKKGFGQ